MLHGQGRFFKRAPGRRRQKSEFSDSLLKPKDKDDYVYPWDKYSFIIDLMHRFEFCYKMEGQRVLVPDNPGITVSYPHLIRLEMMGKLNYIPEGANREYSIKILKVAQWLALPQVPDVFLK